MNSVLQDWVQDLSLMQQGVLLGAMRGADGVPKYNSVKYILRWYRRCTLHMAWGENRVIDNPIDDGGGSYTGPSLPPEARGVQQWEHLMFPLVDDFIRQLDGLPHHFVQHFRHAIQIVGYKHPDERIRQWWNDLYLRLANDEHLRPEAVEEMDRRLSDNYDEWRKRCDDATAK